MGRLMVETNNAKATYGWLVIVQFGWPNHMFFTKPDMVLKISQEGL
jgi:hypothetical protein